MPTITCIYCGLEKESSDEHIVQEALGGVTVIPKVCEDCNRRLGSGIDSVLTVQSPLAILVRKELAGASPKAWDIDENRNGLLLDGVPTPGEDSMIRLPQLVFDGIDQITYFDGDDIEAHGFDGLFRTFNHRLGKAFNHFKLYGPNARRKDHRKKDMLKLEQVADVRPKYRYPPRVCCLGAVMKPKELSFSLRYQKPSDRQKALDALSAMDFQAPFARKEMQFGSENPEIFIGFRPNDIGRAVAKIGFNLLAHLAVTTDPSRANFTRSVEWILEDEHANEFFDLRRHGFVEPDGLAALGCPPDAHKFRLMHDPSTNIWRVYAAFFGGKAAAHAIFRGPNRETWSVIDVVAPLKKHLEPPTFPLLYLPFDTRVAGKMETLMPSVTWLNGEVRVRRERRFEG